MALVVSPQVEDGSRSGFPAASTHSPRFVFDTGPVRQPHARSVRLLRRSVAGRQAAGRPARSTGTAVQLTEADRRKADADQR